MCGDTGPRAGVAGKGLWRRKDAGEGACRRNCWWESRPQEEGRYPGTWVSGGLTDGSKGPVLDHELSTESKVAKAQILQFFLPCLKAVVGKKDDGCIVPAGRGQCTCQGWQFLLSKQLPPATFAGYPSSGLSLPSLCDMFQVTSLWASSSVQRGFSPGLLRDTAGDHKGNSHHLPNAS